MLRAAGIGFGGAGKSIEFIGVGPVGKKRPINSFEYVVQGSVRRVDVAAFPDQDWIDLVTELSVTLSSIPAVKIRDGNGLILLSLENVLLLYFSIQVIDPSVKNILTALISLRAEHVGFSLVRASSLSSLERYLPPTVRTGTPALHSR